MHSMDIQKAYIARKIRKTLNKKNFKKHSRGYSGRNKTRTNTKTKKYKELY